MTRIAAPRWRRLDHDERRADILDVASRLFAARGYAAVGTEEIAREAGVARGLLHHYFGSKRDLFVEVVRRVVRTPMAPVPGPDPGRPIGDVIDGAVDQWLTFVSRNRATWLAALAAEGFGRDPELELIVDEARDATVDVMVAVLGLADRDTPLLRTVLRTYSGLAEQATREWLVRRRLSRSQAHALLASALSALVREVVPAVEGAGADQSRRS